MSQLLKLKQLIFGASAILYLDTSKSDKEQVEEITSITNVFLLEGFVLKPNINPDGSLADFTDEDWRAILAQYRWTYSHSFTLEDAEIVQSLMYSKTELDSQKQEFLYTIEPENKIVDFIIDILQSKTVLRANQLEMLDATPMYILEKAYSKAKITIKETNILVISYLTTLGSEVELFTSLDDIVRFTVSTYGYTPVGIIPTKLNKTVLSQVKLKIPTSIRKVLLKSIDAIIAKHKFNETVKQQVKKYQQFWKRIFKQLAYTTQAKMEKRFPHAFKLQEMLYPLRLTHENGAKIVNKRIATNNTDIEYFRSIGDLGTALTLELDNPGQMIRKIFSYIRYTNGAVYAKKNNNKTSTTVVDDVKDVLNSQMFDNALNSVSLKLLWQVLESIPKNLKSLTTKTVNGSIKIQYNIALPGINQEMSEILAAKISSVILNKQLKANEQFGKVFFDNNCKTLIPMQFSGRDDQSSAMSGAYYPSGSVIDLRQLIDNYLKANPELTEADIIIRAGTAWRGKSCDIDLSTKFINTAENSHYDLYFGRPKLVANTGNGEVILGVSSGDITVCNTEKFSVEFIDFKYQQLSEVFNYAVSILNIFGGAKSFRNIECYYFFDIVSKLEADQYNRAKPFQINLFDQTFAVKLSSDSNTDSNAFYGCHVDFNSEKIFVHAKNDKAMHGQSIAQFANDIFTSALFNERTFINDALQSLFLDNQITTNIEEANIIFTSNQSYVAPEEFKGRVYNFATNEAECQKFYFGE